MSVGSITTAWPSGLEIPEQTQSVLEGLRSFLQAEVEPRYRALENRFVESTRLFGPDGRYVPEVLQARRQIRIASAEAGYYTLFVPESIGGGGMNAVTLYAVWHDLYYRHSMRGFPLYFDSVAHWATGPSDLFLHASTEAREGPFQELMRGQKTMCFALSEPDAGSDIWPMQTTAVREGKGWRINGGKQWQTNGPYADYALVFAVTDREQAKLRKGGITAFLVPATAEGYSVSAVIKLFGHHGTDECNLSFDDVYVDDTARIGELGAGVSVALSGTTLGRIYNSARAMGLARWALELAIEYSKNRETFGSKIYDYQAISFPLAQAATDILAAHLLGMHVARLVDQGKKPIKEAAMMKNLSIATALRVIDRAAQTVGGIGVTTDSLLPAAWQQLRPVQIADGSEEILNRLIARRLARGDLEI